MAFSVLPLSFLFHLPVACRGDSTSFHICSPLLSFILETLISFPPTLLFILDWHSLPHFFPPSSPIHVHLRAFICVYLITLDFMIILSPFAFACSSPQTISSLDPSLLNPTLLHPKFKPFHQQIPHPPPHLPLHLPKQSSLGALRRRYMHKLRRQRVRCCAYCDG